MVAFVALVGCAGAQKQEARARPVDDPTGRSIEYIVKAPFAKAQIEATKVLGRDYRLYGPSTGMTALATPYWHLDTRYREFEQTGKKHRSKCSAHIVAFKEYPDYIALTVGCDVDAYSFGLGRGGIHNLFSDLRWDWYPEEGIYLTQDLIESIVRELGVKEADVIRLRRVQAHEQNVQMIRDHAR
jgi:hypothetical protein